MDDLLVRELPVGTRRYGGKAPEARVAARRAKLLDAAIRLAARGGRESVTVTNACSEAGLTTRYFYESFAGKDELFAQAYATVGKRLLHAMVHRSSARAGVHGEVEAFFGVLAHEPREARVFLLDLDHLDPLLQQEARVLGSRLGGLFVPHAASDIARSGALGAILAIAREWIAADFQPPISDIVDLAVRFARTANERHG